MNDGTMGTEQYEVYYQYQDPNGYWKRDSIVMNGYHTKIDHEQAGKDFLKDNPEAVILKIVYC